MLPRRLAVHFARMGGAGCRNASLRKGRGSRYAAGRAGFRNGAGGAVSRGNIANKGSKQTCRTDGTVQCPGAGGRAGPNRGGRSVLRRPARRVCGGGQCCHHLRRGRSAGRQRGVRPEESTGDRPGRGLAQNGGGFARRGQHHGQRRGPDRCGLQLESLLRAQPFLHPGRQNREDRFEQLPD